MFRCDPYEFLSLEFDIEVYKAMLRIITACSIGVFGNALVIAGTCLYCYHKGRAGHFPCNLDLFNLRGNLLQIAVTFMAFAQGVKLRKLDFLDVRLFLGVIVSFIVAVAFFLVGPHPVKYFFYGFRDRLLEHHLELEISDWATHIVQIREAQLRKDDQYILIPPPEIPVAVSGLFADKSGLDVVISGQPKPLHYSISIFQVKSSLDRWGLFIEYPPPQNKADSAYRSMIDPVNGISFVYSVR